MNAITHYPLVVKYTHLCTKKLTIDDCKHIFSEDIELNYQIENQESIHAKGMKNVLMLIDQHLSKNISNNQVYSGEMQFLGEKIILKFIASMRNNIKESRLNRFLFRETSTFEFTKDKNQIVRIETKMTQNYSD